MVRQYLYEAGFNWGIQGIYEKIRAGEYGTLAQGVGRAAGTVSQIPERIPSLEQRLGVQEGAFNNLLNGFNNFTTQAERVISEVTSVGNVRDINGKMIYYIDGALTLKKEL